MSTRHFPEHHQFNKQLRDAHVELAKHAIHVPVLKEVQMLQPLISKPNLEAKSLSYAPQFVQTSKKSCATFLVNNNSAISSYQSKSQPEVIKTDKSGDSSIQKEFENDSHISDASSGSDTFDETEQHTLDGLVQICIEKDRQIANIVVSSSYLRQELQIASAAKDVLFQENVTKSVEIAELSAKLEAALKASSESESAVDDFLSKLAADLNVKKINLENEALKASLSMKETEVMLLKDELLTKEILDKNIEPQTTVQNDSKTIQSQSELIKTLKSECIEKDSMINSLFESMKKDDAVIESQKEMIMKEKEQEIIASAVFSSKKRKYLAESLKYKELSLSDITAKLPQLKNDVMKIELSNKALKDELLETTLSSDGRIN